MNRLNRITRTTTAVLLVSAALLFPGSQANAAGMLELNMENVPTVLGIGVGALPDYRGSDDYTFGFAPMFRYTIKDQERYIQLLANELTVNVIDDEMFRFGPLLNYTFGRSSVDDEVVDRMNDIDDTLEVGAFADVVWEFSKDRRHRFILGAKVYQDVLDNSDGFRANLNARYWLPVAKPVDLNISVGAFYQSDDWANYYYGVNSGNVGTSGLPFFNADGGVNEYYMVVGCIFYLDRNWLISAGVRGSVIAGDPADSPIVDQRGDSTQWIGGIGVGYAFW